MAENNKNGKKPLNDTKKGVPQKGSKSRKSKKEQEKPVVNVVIKKHPQLFELLHNPDAMWRILFSLFLILVVIFFGIAFVVILVKRYYPYNIIETNIQGATIMKSEDKDVYYWLFNTADLWANSGIEVHKGDILTIRASGASFTAVHHLVDAASNNSIPEDRWVGTEGQPKLSPRDLARAEHRIDKDFDEGILLMKVIPAKLQNSSANWIEKVDDSILTGGDIEVIGKERKELKVSKSGILHFAVNDIVLTEGVLSKMYRQYIDKVVDQLDISLSEKDSKTLFANFDSIKFENNKGTIVLSNIELLNILKKQNDLYWDKDKADSAKKIGLALGYYPTVEDDTTVNTNKFHEAYPLINELVYYKQKRYRNAWYDDNLGSFLIVIERKK